MAEQYLHDPLPDDGLHIRLLRLSSGGDSAIPHIELQTARFSEVEGRYDALSYMWGPPEPAHQVELPDQLCLTVRDNLWRFLLHYRKTAIADKAEYLWIDSICINQQNLSEKSAQVAEMGTIFRGARRVLVWLGEASEAVAITQNDVDCVNQIFASQEFPYGANEEKDEELPRVKFWKAEMTQNHVFFAHRYGATLDERERNDRLRAYLKSVCRHPYWSRLWMVQEIYLARGGPKVIAGSMLLEDDFLNVLNRAAVLYGKEDSESLLKASEKQYSFHRLTGRELSSNFDATHSDGQVNSLASLLHGYCLQGCFDHRDRVFGLIGLLEPKTPGSLLPVDYRMDHRVLFLHVLNALLRENDKPVIDGVIGFPRPVLSWIRWLSWALDVDCTVVDELAGSDEDVLGDSLSWAYLAPAQDQHGTSVALRASDLFINSVFDVPISSPHTRLYPKGDPALGEWEKRQASKVSDDVGRRLKLWCRGKLPSFIKLGGQTWVCQLDEAHYFPLAIQPLDSGGIRVVGYVAQDEPYNEGYGEPIAWKVVSLPTEIGVSLQRWFDKNISHIKQRWLEHQPAMVSLSIVQLLEIAQLSVKMAATRSNAGDLMELMGKPDWV